MTDDQVSAVLARIGSAELITHHSDTGLVATNLPFLHDPSVGPKGALLGHVARNNRQWSDPVDGEALVIVTETDHYVSPAWLPSKAEHGKVVPTWNYVTVHVHGELIAHDDIEWTCEVVRRLTERHELGADQPWSVEDAPEGYIDAMLRAIVGIELRITRIVAKAKMAQNKTPADVEAIASVLAAQGDSRGEDWLRKISLPAAERRAALIAEVGAQRERR